MTSAAARVREESATWAAVAAAWHAERHPGVWAMRPATEVAVVVFHDPRADLERRAAEWSYQLGAGDLADIARFAAALAAAEAEAWEADEPHVATRAYEDRRFLVGDRLLHWAVPWLDAADDTATRDLLLDIGDQLRPAPLLVRGEGVLLPGHDEFGPRPEDLPIEELLGSVWGGLVQLGPPVPDPARYDLAATRWEGLATAHSGTAALWAALAGRAAATARRLRATPHPPPSRSAP